MAVSASVVSTVIATYSTNDKIADSKHLDFNANNNGCNLLCIGTIPFNEACY